MLFEGADQVGRRQLRGLANVFEPEGLRAVFADVIGGTLELEIGFAQRLIDRVES
ncbi:hypothetical protein D3C72_2450100 [compost metagenome]